MPLSNDPAKRARQLANLKRAPAAPAGNVRAVRHGALRRVLDSADLDAAEQRIRDALRDDLVLYDASDEAIIRALADTLCRLDSLADYFRRRGIEDSKGALREGALDLERRLRAQALDLAGELGMTPRSRLALGLDLVRTEQAAEEARAAREARERLDARLAQLDVDGGEVRDDDSA